MNQYRITMIIISLIVILVNLHCGNQVSGVETTNGVRIIVHAEIVDGTTPPFTDVYLFDKKYIPYIDSGLGVVITSGSDGHFSFSDITVDTISVTMMSRDNLKFARVQTGTAGFEYETSLGLPGSIKGSVTTSVTDPILIFLEGTGYYVFLQEPGIFEFNLLPQGAYTLKAATVKRLNGKPSIDLMSTSKKLTVVSGKTQNISLITIP